jgi:hypothetical protein
MDQSIPERVAATLSDLGLPAPANIIQTMLMHDGYFVGWKIACPAATSNVASLSLT